MASDVLGQLFKDKEYKATYIDTQLYICIKRAGCINKGTYINKDDGYTTADNECINANISTWMPEISRELHTKGFFGIVHLSVHWEMR